MLWFSCRCGSCFLFSFPSSKFGDPEIWAKKSGSFGVFFSECLHRHQRHLWLGSGRQFDETSEPWCHLQDATYVFFLKTYLNLPSKQMKCLKCLYVFFNQKLDKQKSNVELVSQSKIHGFCWNSRKFVACHSCSCRDFCSHEKISGTPSGILPMPAPTLKEIQ